MALFRISLGRIPGVGPSAGRLRAHVRLMSALSFTPLEAIPELVASVDPRKRKWDDKCNAMIPMEDRKKLLQGLLDMMENERAAINQAEFEDLRRPKSFSDRILDGTVGSTALALNQLDTWAAPQKCDRAPENAPGHNAVASYVRREPKGLALIISTWNFPIPLTLKPLASALAAGCPCVVKLDRTCVHVSELLKRILEQYLDPTYVKVVYGGRDQTTALLKEKYGVIFYTGSPSIGRVIYRAAAEHLTPVVLELGGRNPVFVTKSADLEICAKKLVDKKFQNVGQFCVSPDHVFVEKGVDVGAFTQALVNAVKNSFGDDPQKSEAYSRVINTHHFERLERAIDERDHGGQILVGGKATADKSDNYIPPTIILNPSYDSLLMNDEIFGPVLPIVECDMEEALAYTHEHGDPLAAYIFSSDEKEIQRILGSTRSGGVCINDCIVHMLNETLPFGGRDCSGFGSYHGEWGFKSFSHERAVMQISATSYP